MAREVHDALVKAGVSEEQRAAVLQEMAAAAPQAPQPAPQPARVSQHVHIHFHGEASMYLDIKPEG